MRAIRYLLCMATAIGAVVSSAQAQPCDVNEIAKLLAQDGAAYDMFGYAVAIDADTAVVGADGDSPNSQSPGYAYVFERIDGQWTYTATLSASDGQPKDQFGITVAISGDTIMVGASKCDEFRGAVYAFEKPKDGWKDMNETCKFRPDDNEVGDSFSTVAISGDTAVIGASGDDDKGNLAGAVYVFVRDGDCWTQSGEKLYSPDDPGPGTYFGTRVAIQGNILLIGQDNGGGVHPDGAAYLFEWVENEWKITTLLPGDGGHDGRLGSMQSSISADASVVLVPDWSNNNENGPFAGAVYVFLKPQDGWPDGEMDATYKIINPEGEANERFGKSTALDASGSIAVVSAFEHNGDCADNSGAAYVFFLGELDAQLAATLTASDCQADAKFGADVSISEGTVLVGAALDDNENGVDAGAVYVFHGIDDCQPNGTLDLCDIQSGNSQDDDGNGRPDECETCDILLARFKVRYKRNCGGFRAAATLTDLDGLSVGRGWRVCMTAEAPGEPPIEVCKTTRKKGKAKVKFCQLSCGEVYDICVSSVQDSEGNYHAVCDETCVERVVPCTP